MRLLPLLTFAIAISAPAVAAENVPVQPFRSIELRGGGNVLVRRAPVQRVTIVSGSAAFTEVRVDRQGRLRIDACNARCPRNYRLEIIVESPRVPDVAVRGGGSITAGSAFAGQQQLSAAISGGGRIDIRSASVANVSAAINGGGEILVRPRGHLSAAVHGGGRVRYWGNPQVTTAIAGGGSVQRGG
jgi:hypothetical protein